MRLFLVALLLTSCQKYTEDLYTNTVEQADRTQVRLPETKPAILPKCHEICFEDYRGLKQRDNDFDFLAFANFGYRGIGRCRGHAIVAQKLYELSEFKEEKNVNCDPKNLTVECKLSIEEKIQKIMDFKVENFPGFKNLYEFSSHPEVQEILKSYVRGISHRFKAVQANIRDTSYGSQFKNIFYEILERIKEKQRPYIGVKGTTIGDHALLAHSETYGKEGVLICVHDSNIIFDQQGDQCQNYLYMQEDDVYYKRSQKEATLLYTFSLTSDEDKRVGHYIKARYQYCMKVKKENGQCK